MANHDVWDAVAQTEGTPANSYEMLVGVKAAGSPSFTRSGDVTNVNPAFTAKTRARQTYAAKGADLAIKYGDTLALSFDVELIRDENGQFQPFAQDLIDAAKQNGLDNLREIQVYDALGADLALEGKFAISFSRSGTGWDEASFLTITATQYGRIEWIDNPVLTGNVPVISAVLPADAGDGDAIYIQGSNLGNVVEATPTNVTIGGVNAADFEVVSDSLIVATMPTGDAGSAPVAVHNPSGTTTVPYVRGA